MSNLSVLLAVDTDGPSTSGSPPAKALRTGYSMVPPFWLACFRRGDFANVAVPVQDASGQQSTLELAMLWTPRARALDNLRAFREAIRSCPAMLGESEPSLQALTAALERSPAPFLQLYDAEIQMMVGPQENRAWLTMCLLFVEDVATARVTGDDVLRAPQALELFDQAQIQVPQWTCEQDWEDSLIGVAG